MAQTGTDLSQETISCSICQDLLQDPTTIPCGHNYCMNCIKSYWDQEGKSSCPECREKFKPRPNLVKNTMLAALVEQLKKTGIQPAPADHCYAGPGDVACDVCTGKKLKATKSCLVCQIYYCKKHLQPHYENPSFKNHKLVESSIKLQQLICSRHNEEMKIFCRTDQQSICYLYLMDEHRGHQTVSAAAERAERQKELEVSRQQIQQGILDREKDVKLLQQEVEAINASADKTVQDSEKIFSELIRLIHKRSSDVKQQIRSQQETEGCRVKGLQEKLQQEITELKRKDAELEKLSRTEDHNQFLHSYPSLPALSESTHSSSFTIRPLGYFADVTAAVSELRDQLQDILTDRWTNISLTVTDVDVLLSDVLPEPKSRAGFLRHAKEITLDPNTAHPQLLISTGRRKATYMKQPQLYSEHPDRFTHWCQVLSREGLTGRCYWEVDWSGVVEITVSYRNITRAVSGPRSSRVGVYLDHKAGILSFYSVSESMALLHRVQTTFTQPLHAGLWFLTPSDESTAEIMKLK
ncbi:tripartite motif-containing protein 16-like [Melanotaenia boesemani]|uniref:tripartite motif-containing protein 16-like n=1 Tax=Melanotaenia boesemani TaxID=1250792 RepID=UPI001C041709|nr:tripartite motif-containing protein 16-like [Melanotaenia boesemani]